VVKVVVDGEDVVFVDTLKAVVVGLVNVVISVVDIEDVVFVDVLKADLLRW